MSARVPPANLTEAELIEDLDFLAAAGVGTIEAGRRTGYTVDAIDRRLRRHGRADLVTRLHAQDPISLDTATIRADRYQAWARSPEGRAVVTRAARFLEHARATDPVPDDVAAQRRTDLYESAAPRRGAVA